MGEKLEAVKKLVAELEEEYYWHNTMAQQGYEQYEIHTKKREEIHRLQEAISKL